MNETLPRRLPTGFFKMGAGLAQPDAAKDGLPDLELAADEVVEGDAAGGEIAAAFRGGELYVIVAGEGGEGLGLNEGGLAQFVVRGRISAGAVVVPISFEPETFHDPDLLEVLQKIIGGWGDLDRNDDAGLHVCSLGSSRRTKKYLPQMDTDKSGNGVAAKVRRGESTFGIVTLSPEELQI